MKRSIRPPSQTACPPLPCNHQSTRIPEPPTADPRRPPLETPGARCLTDRPRQEQGPKAGDAPSSPPFPAPHFVLGIAGKLVATRSSSPWAGVGILYVVTSFHFHGFGCVGLGVMARADLDGGGREWCSAHHARGATARNGRCRQGGVAHGGVPHRHFELGMRRGWRRARTMSLDVLRELVGWGGYGMRAQYLTLTIRMPRLGSPRPESRRTAPFYRPVKSGEGKNVSSGRSIPLCLCGDDEPICPCPTRGTSYELAPWRQIRRPG